MTSIYSVGVLNGKLTALDPEKIQSAVTEGVRKIKGQSSLSKNAVPVGSVIAFAGPRASIPKGWMLCNGDQVDKNQPEYEKLVRAIGYTYGGSMQDGFLKLPNFEGHFLRGIDLKGKVDKDGIRVVGSSQMDSTRLPNKPFWTSKDGNHQHNYSANDMAGNRGGKDEYWYSSQTPKTPFTFGDATHIHTISAGGDEETRPVNSAVFWIIKVSPNRSLKR